MLGDINMRTVIFDGNLELALNWTGIFVFAISGALLAIQKRFDIVGMVVLAEVTAIGGGVVRDLILGAVPPASFTDAPTLLIPLGAVILLFVLYRYLGQSESRVIRRFASRLQIAVLVFDAAGLGLFCVAGAEKALAYGLGPVPAIMLGAITAVGGGVMRDVLANDQPVVLRADSVLYAVPAVLGATIVVAVERAGLFGPLIAGGAALLVFVLRVAALRYGWRAPQAARAQPPRAV
jgi:uncharacterized membrane protein YeiH